MIPLKDAVEFAKPDHSPSSGRNSIRNRLGSFRKTHFHLRPQSREVAPFEEDEEIKYSEEEKLKMAKVMQLVAKNNNVSFGSLTLDRCRPVPSRSDDREEGVHPRRRDFLYLRFKNSVRKITQAYKLSTTLEVCSYFTIRNPFAKPLFKLQSLSKKHQITSRWFDRFIIFFIFLNSLALACYDYSDRANISKQNQIIEKSGKAFTGIFFVEFLLKVISMGFFLHRKSYLRDGWNWIDFIVVVIGIVELIPGLPSTNLKALRTLRVLRPLRSINAVPRLRRLISSLLGSLPALANVVVFLGFILVLFGILGVQ